MVMKVEYGGEYSDDSSFLCMNLLFTKWLQNVNAKGIGGFKC